MAECILSVAFKIPATSVHVAFPSLDELIAADHPVRVVNQVMHKIDTYPLLKKYKGGGAGSFHPPMLLNGLVYSYINNITAAVK